jgi:carboxylesterase type B
VVDGVILKDWPAFYALPKLPTILGGTSMEAAFLYNFYDPLSNKLISPPAPVNEAISMALQHMLNALYNLTDVKQTFNEVVSNYQQLSQADCRTDNLATIAMEIFSDMAGQHYAVRKAELAVVNGNDGVYFYQYALPLLPPNAEPAHATELSITFGTFLHPHYREKIGDGELQRAVSKAMIEAFASFAATGHPCSAQLPSWFTFHQGGKNVMIFGRDTNTGQLTEMPKYNRLSILDKLAALQP